jgi:hypothetical protein
MEVIKRILFLSSFLFALFLSNCCDDAAPCQGFEEEPLLYLRNDSTQFRVIYVNDKGTGDTTPLSNISKLPIDMNSLSMSYTFLAPENKGFLKLNYTIAIEKLECDCKEKYLINLKNIKLDSTSTFSSVYDHDYGNKVRIDSALSKDSPYRYYYYYYVNF